MRCDAAAVALIQCPDVLHLYAGINRLAVGQCRLEDALGDAAARCLIEGRVAAALDHARALDFASGSDIEGQPDGARFPGLYRCGWIDGFGAAAKVDDGLALDDWR